MKRNFGFKVLYLLTAVVVLVNLAFIIKNSVYFDIDELPKGELVLSEGSPDGEHTLNIYVIKNSIGEAVRGEVVTENQSRNIFWQTGVSFARLRWQNNTTVVINGVYINVTDGTTYDSRRGVSLFQEGALEGIDAPSNRNFKNEQK